MGGQIGRGAIDLFIDHSNTIIKNEDFDTQIYFDLYDPDSSFLIDNAFIGANMTIKITPVYSEDQTRISSPLNEGNLSMNLNDEVELIITPPIQITSRSRLNNITAFMEIGLFPTNDFTYKLHCMFIFMSMIEYQTIEISLFDDEPLYYPTLVTKTRNTNFVATMVCKNLTQGGNSYLYALSVIDNQPEYHVFIISDTVSWIKKIPLKEIIDSRLLVDPTKNIVNFIEEQNVLIIQAYRYNYKYFKEESFFFYKVDNGNIEFYDVVVAAETEHLMSKFIYIEEALYYLIYSDAHYIDVYTLDPDTNKHYIEYRLNTNETKYVSGQS